ncbi:TolB family protein [Muriicola soli]|uniref:TolB family protein n=1 Tax=Muriicola soli TaxID=2507538 RepID=UPI001C2B90A2|nr:transporter [Muriicola soli]
MISRLETYDLNTGERNLILEENAHFEAPNWSLDGTYLIINQDGLLFKITPGLNTKELIDTGEARQCNNDHGISPDGTLLAISNNDQMENSGFGTSRIYTLPIAGGLPTRITEKAPSYWHGWAPDGKSVVYTAHRNGDFDIYRIGIKGGQEVRLTEEAGLDDGPEYSPDGRFIYYNSYRSGSMELWRMNADGRNKVQLTDDIYSNWFPHPSPDGKYLVFLTYLEDQGQAHPPLKLVALRLYNLQNKQITSLCTFIGGQGTLNVPSWAPDSEKFAFVSYEPKK